MIASVNGETRNIVWLRTRVLQK